MPPLPRLGRIVALAATLLQLPTMSPHAQGQSPQPTPFQYNAYGQQVLIRALIEQDIPALMGFRSGLVVENHGLPQGLAHYLKSFNAELSQIFLCPTLMPAGFDAQIDSFIAQRSLDPTVSWPAAKDALQILLDRFRQGGDLPVDPRALIEPLLDGQTMIQRLKSQGQRDARLFWKQTECEGPQADALAQGVEVLMQHLQTLH